MTDIDLNSACENVRKVTVLVVCYIVCVNIDIRLLLDPCLVHIVHLVQGLELLKCYQSMLIVK